MIEIEPFNLPISFLENKQEIQQHIINDLELDNNSEHQSLYNTIFNPTTKFGTNIIPMWNKYYTTDTKFLKDTQKLISSELPVITDKYKNIEDIWNNIKTETAFIEKYQYIDWNYFKQLNDNSSFLQLWSIYNMAAPFLSLVLPILFLIVPFFILKFQGINISVSSYFHILKQVFSKHQIGLLFSLSSVSFEKCIYIIFSVFFYILQIYQNIISCIKFVSNMSTYHEQLFSIRTYINETIDNMNLFGKSCASLDSYTMFIDNMNVHKNMLIRFKHELDAITPYKMSIHKLAQFGHIMKCFYQLYNNDSYKVSLAYSFGFNGYLDNLQGLNANIASKSMNICKYSKKKCSFKDAFFPIISKPIKNSYNLNKHIIITGPNAAGKTTLLKTTIFNLLISQQIGFGFYNKAQIHPYDFIHCYINIPDTSGRDSLFQAEARRCVDILNNIESNQKSRHFCIFDELYSGTNPYEAIGSAISFLKYLNKYSTVNFMITTHFLEICKRLKDQEEFYNCHMNILSDSNNKFIYTYKLNSGISNVKGGINVLKDLDYPEEIIQSTIEIIDNLNI